MISEYQKLFGLDFEKKELKVENLPIYLTARRSFFRLSYNNMEFILVCLPKDEKYGVIAFEKQEKLISEKYGMPVAFGFQNLSKLQRDGLIAKNIPFISDSGQLYLPFLGIALRNQFAHMKKSKADKMMPATQALFLYLLYRHNNILVMKKDAAEAIAVTRTSLTRASEQLEEMGLISQKKMGKEYLMQTEGSGIDLYRKAKPYLINPVQSVVTVEDDSMKYFSYPIAGESALAEITMLSRPTIPVCAVWKNDIKMDEISEIDIRWDIYSKPIQLQLWKYKPELFAKNDRVDPVSLAMSFENNVDERIEGAIEEYLEEYQW